MNKEDKQYFSDLLQMQTRGFHAVLTTFKSDIVQFVKDEGRSNRDFVRQEIQASEHRVKSELRSELRQEIQASEKRIIDSVSDVLNGSIVPQLDNHEQRLTKLETKPA